MLIPRARIAPAANQAEPAILLVNDDPGALFALRSVLGDLDANLVTASSGERALSRLLKQDFHVVLMDVRMAGLGGYETTRRIRANPHFAHVPVIALKARAMLQDRAKCLAAGASDYASKPVHSGQLSVQLEGWLDRQAAAGQ